MVRAINEGGFPCTEIDFIDLLAWLERLNPEESPYAQRR